MEEFESDLVSYFVNTEELKEVRQIVLEPTKQLLNGFTENARVYLGKLSSIQDINHKINKGLAELEFLIEENDELDSKIGRLNTKIQELNSIQIPPVIDSPVQSIDVHSEDVARLKALLSEYEYQLSLMKKKHPEYLAGIRSGYITKLQKLKNELRLQKFLFKLSKVNMSQEASVHSFITREELKEELSKVSQSNKLYYEQMQKATIISTPKPALPTLNLPSNPDTLYIVLTCIIYFLLSSLISKLVISNNNLINS